MFIRTMKIKGKLYYSIVESKRVDGNMKQFTHAYLGTAESLLRKIKKKR